MNPFSIRLMCKKKNVEKLLDIMDDPKSPLKLVKVIPHATWMYTIPLEEVYEKKYMYEFEVEFRSKAACMRFLKENKGNENMKHLISTYSMKRGFASLPTGYFL